MPHVAVEAVIMTPLLILQIVLLPIVATTMTSNWSAHGRDVAVQEVANQLAGVVQQLYTSLNMKEVQGGTVRWASTLPKQVVSHPYTAKGWLQTWSGSNSSKILTLQIELKEVGNIATATVALGLNVLWNETSVFRSDYPDAAIEVQKSEGILSFTFK